MEPPKQKRTGVSTNERNTYPQYILDIIKSDYPKRYAELTNNSAINLESQFTREEWIRILTKSRESYGQWLKHTENRNHRLFRIDN